MKKHFQFLGKKKNEVIDVEMTSLLDILVILLFFLIKNYNSSDLTVDPLGNLKMANSTAKELGHMSVTVQVSKERKIWVDDSPIGTLDKNSPVSNVLAKSLDEKRVKFLEKKIDPTKINLVFDKDLPYEAIAKVMHTAAIKGYPDFKLIVKGNE